MWTQHTGFCHKWLPNKINTSHWPLLPGRHWNQKERVPEQPFVHNTDFPQALQRSFKVICHQELVLELTYMHDTEEVCSHSKMFTNHTDILVQIFPWHCLLLTSLCFWNAWSRNSGQTSLSSAYLELALLSDPLLCTCFFASHWRCTVQQGRKQRY